MGKEIAVELKNDVVLTGTLHSVDQYLNVKLLNVQVVQPEKYPQLTALQNCFIRGSVVRYIQIPPEHVDTELLQDAARKENAPAKKTAWFFVLVVSLVSRRSLFQTDWLFWECQSWNDNSGDWFLLLICRMITKWRICRGMPQHHHRFVSIIIIMIMVYLLGQINVYLCSFSHQTIVASWLSNCTNPSYPTLLVMVLKM